MGAGSVQNVQFFCSWNQDQVTFIPQMNPTGVCNRAETTSSDSSVVLVCTLITVFTPTQMNCTKGENGTEFDSAKLNKTAVKTPLETKLLVLFLEQQYETFL